MKISDGFDARRLRPRPSGSWRLRFGVLLGILTTLGGVLLALFGAFGLAGLDDRLGAVRIETDAALLALLGGLALAGLGGFLWRRCKRRLRQPGGLSMAPHLFRKRG